MPLIRLKDSDGDGIITFKWEKRYTGVTVKLYDWLCESNEALFDKHELLDSLKTLVRKLENELES